MLETAYLICVHLQRWNHAIYPFTWRFDVQSGDCTWSDGLFFGLLDTSSLVILDFIWSHVIESCSSLIFITSWDWLCAPLFWVKIMMLVDEIHLCLPHMCLNLIHQRKLHHPLHLCAMEVQVLQKRNWQTHHCMKVYFSYK